MTSMPKLFGFAAICAALALSSICAEAGARRVTHDVFPDGSAMGGWFADTARVDVREFGPRFVVTDYGVRSDDSILIQTAQIQAVIDTAAACGGGVVVIPDGVYLSGALFFRQGTRLHIERGGKLKGVDDIAHYPIKSTRIEGRTINYFCALVNADSLSRFSITGGGSIDGNGLRFWREFWLRRKVNSACTNIEALRPRLVYVSNCNDVDINDVTLQNSPFWTLHLYRCQRVKIIGTSTFAPHEGVKAPSSDAIDVDNCRDVLINRCYMSVNDDAVALKGGKGTWADLAPENGPNVNVVISDCTFGFVHSCLTLGSESVADRNIVMRNCVVKNAKRVLWLKLRPDTPQTYEYVTVDGIRGRSENFLVIRPWTQFFSPSERPDMPLSVCRHVAICNVNMACDKFYNVGASDKYSLSHFSFKNVNVRCADPDFNTSAISDVRVDNVILVPTGAKVSDAVQNAGNAD